MTIAVLALQGAFIEHEQVLCRLGVDCFEVRSLADWGRHKDGLIIPGGESTTQLKLLNDLHLLSPIRDFITGGGAVFGTCAGLILLAKKVVGDNIQRISTMNIEARRNAYGRQLGSFHTDATMKGVGVVPMTFIRAPYIEHAGDGVEVLAEVDGHIVAARQGRQLVTAFHPELSPNTSDVHRFFIEQMVEKR